MVSSAALAKEKIKPLHNPCTSDGWALRQNVYYFCGDDHKWHEMDSILFLYGDLNPWTVTNDGTLITCVNHGRGYSKKTESNIPKITNKKRLENMQTIFDHSGNQWVVCQGKAK
ncbi:hypothetical protein HGA64_02675 [Candidatus Falkowbacteria bacterium]|nr:hypothetical protein [Candidatus Falkowbacteria bacterium]